MIYLILSLLVACSSGPAPSGAPVPSSAPPVPGAAVASPEANPDPAFGSQFAFASDRSSSIEHGGGEACNAVATTMESLLGGTGIFGAGGTLSGLKMTRGQSTFKLFATPSAELPEKPVAVWEGSQTTVELGLEMTPADRKEIYIKKDKEIADELRKTCQLYAIKQEVSPIYATVKAAAEHLRNICAAPGMECLLVIQSDFIETQEPSLVRYVKAIKKGKGEPTGDISTPPIDLGGNVSVLACGSGASSDSDWSTAAREQVLTLWKDKILTNPKRWASQATCPGYAPTPVEVAEP